MKKLILHEAALFVVLSLVLLFLWGVIEGAKLLPQAFEHPTPTATTPTATPVPSTPTIGPVSELEEPLPPLEPLLPVAGGNFTDLALPDGTAVVHGTASDGTAYPYCFYWAPTHEIVLVDGCNDQNRVHELCHAHQHWSINGGRTLRPSDYDLESWYVTDEGRSFAAAVAGLPFPWTQSAANGLEDFAWTCTYWYLDLGHLVTVGGQERYRWVKENLP